MQKTLKFTIITPTLLRPSLDYACKSIDSQSYTNWRHLIAIDATTSDHPKSFDHPNRLWHSCGKNHHNFGNTCRHNLFQFIDNDTDYIIYLDDDNHYLGESLTLLNEELNKRDFPDWGIFPMLMLGKRFIDPNPRVNKSDTNQLFHKPFISDQPITWLDIPNYEADGLLINKLRSLCKPAILNNLPELSSLSSHSFGVRPVSSVDYAVVIPNKYDDIIRPLISSIQTLESRPTKVVIVADGHSRNYGYELVQTTDKFVFSKSANLGIKHFSDLDIILVNDDIRLIQPNTFKRMHDLAYSDPFIGMFAPLVDGGCGNPFMHANDISRYWKGHKDDLMFFDAAGPKFIPFTCVYLKRKMLNEIGLMDENFQAYGMDDVDMSIRAVKAGWKIATARSITVKHGDGGGKLVRGTNYSLSFSRTGSGNQRVNTRYFLSKHRARPKSVLPVQSTQLV